MHSRVFAVARVLLFLLLPVAVGQAQEYLWPTDASKLLTSTFGESRGRRFHTGIDVKTWGRTGYPAFAIRPGYVWRVRVSPYGYGKAVYLKLDTGEIVLYAHLSKFSEKIEKMVKAEQKRLGQYSINKYLKPGELPVAQGEVIAYTGQSGIGAPHLHFEIRDPANRPINPLAKGYALPDRLSPVVTRVSFTPLDMQSSVDGDCRPAIYTPARIRSGKYMLDETVAVAGRVGIGVSCYDMSAPRSHRFGVHHLKLFVDDVLRFEYRYDRLSFSKNRFIQLERDYRMARRGWGHFHKLYRDKHNQLSHYRPQAPWAGVLKSASWSKVLDLEPRYKSTEAPEPVDGGAATPDGVVHGLWPGLHTFRIEIGDYFGNVTTVEGELQVGEHYSIYPVVERSDEGLLSLVDVHADDFRRIEELQMFALEGNRWQPLAVEWSQDVMEKGGFGSSQVPETMEDVSPVGYPLQHAALKFVARDQFGTRSYPHIFVPNDLLDLTREPPELTLATDFYDDYVRVEVHSSTLLRKRPKLVLHPGARDSVFVELRPVDARHYVAPIALSQFADGPNLLVVTGENGHGRDTVYEEVRLARVDPREVKSVRSEDGGLHVNFWLNSLYDPLYVRIFADSVADTRDYDLESNVYEIHPRDVPFNLGAIVHLRYPEGESNPEKLGVYYETSGGRWVFVDNRVDETEQTVWARVLSFEKFALVRDEVPPTIYQIIPGPGARLSDARPVISFKVRDRLSGLGGEESIELRLNGEKTIAEYDPERHRVSYRPDMPLSPGRHEISIEARDRCGNVATLSSHFWVN